MTRRGCQKPDVVVRWAGWVPGITLALGACILLLWITQSRAAPHALRLPGADDPDGRRRADQVFTLPEGRLEAEAGTPSAVRGAWPQFRGAERDAVNKDGVRLARSWPAGGPPVLWSVPLGEGYAAPAVRHGRVYVFDHDLEAGRDTLRCLSLDTGEEIWNYSYPLDAKRNHGVSRTIPAVGEDHVVALGPRCHVIANDARTGELLWMIDLRERYGTTEPLWYAGQCPLIVGDTVILAPAGPDALLVALDTATGEERWRTPNDGGWTMSHSSIMPMERRGVRMFVYLALGGAVGVEADTGRILWTTDAFRMHTISPSPVQLDDDRILLMAGYGRGAAVLRLRDTEDGTMTAEVEATFRPREFGSEQQTPILHGDSIFTVLPKPGQELVCADLDLRVRWSSGSENSFGLGPYLLADGLLFLMNDHGLLTLAEANPEAYRPLAEAQVLHGADSWGPMALVEGRLLLRDMERMVCLDVSEAGVAGTVTGTEAETGAATETGAD